jgi:hypothetical protein
MFPFETGRGACYRGLQLWGCCLFVLKNSTIKLIDSRLTNASARSYRDRKADVPRAQRALGRRANDLYKLNKVCRSIN